jgi:transcriptional regulator with XRE-family HTH domain
MQRPQLDAERVTKARYSRGLNAAELAEKAGISKQLLSDIEHGRRFGSPATQKRIADALELEVAELWAKEGAA